MSIVNDLIEQSRTLTFELHPAVLDHFGVAEALRRYAEQFSRQTSVELTINEQGTPRPLAGAIPNYVFRSVKELIHNAARHGHAKEIVVSLYWIPSWLRVLIDDDGSGFDSTQAFSVTVKKGLGLAGINERMRSLGGSLRLESSAGSGTRAVMEIPTGGGDAAGTAAAEIPDRQISDREISDREISDREISDKAARLNEVGICLEENMEPAGNRDEQKD